MAVTALRSVDGLAQRLKAQVGIQQGFGMAHEQQPLGLQQGVEPLGGVSAGWACRNRSSRSGRRWPGRVRSHGPSLIEEVHLPEGDELSQLRPDTDLALEGTFALEEG